MGLSYLKLGEFNQAIELLEQARSIQESINDRYDLGITLNSLGNAYFQIGKLDQATELILQSLDFAEEVDNRKGEAESRWALALIYHQYGKANLAIEQAHMARNIYQGIGLANKSRQIDEILYSWNLLGEEENL
jgi:tetratricopeptide (TPR) repeat protein